MCDPTDSSPPGSSVPGILQVRRLEWVAISFSIREYYKAIKKKKKKNKIISVAATWMHLQIVILSEVSQRKTNII